MGKIYVSASTLDEAINYFTHTEYSSPEQLGLFFLFKGMKFNSKEYHTFYKEGEARKKNTLLMYFLCGIDTGWMLSCSWSGKGSCGDARRGQADSGKLGR